MKRTLRICAWCLLVCRFSPQLLPRASSEHSAVRDAVGEAGHRGILLPALNHRNYGENTSACWRAGELRESPDYTRCVSWCLAGGGWGGGDAGRPLGEEKVHSGAAAEAAAADPGVPGRDGVCHHPHW